MNAYLQKYFSIDFKTLSFFRIFIGFIVLFDLMTRSFSITEHYSEAGLLPLNTLDLQYGAKYYWSLFSLSSHLVFTQILFLIGFIFNILFIIGKFTKVSTIVLWIIVLSIQYRNPSLIQSGDDLLRILLFWSMFLPLNKNFSIDYMRKEKISGLYFSYANIGILLQIALLYFFTASLKTGSEWFNGEGVYYALMIDQYTTPFAKILLKYPGFLKLLTYFTLFIEWLALPLLFSPLRKITAISLIFMHLGFLFFLKLGIFPWVDIAALSLFFNFDKSVIKINYSYRYFYLGMISFVILINISQDSRFLLHSSVEKTIFPVAEISGLRQYWKMFAPSPSKNDGWFIGVVYNKDGSKEFFMDDIDGQKVTFERPDHISEIYRDQRWRKYYTNLLKKNKKYLRLRYGQYYCEKFDAVKIELYFNLEKSLLDEKYESRRVKVLEMICEK